MESVLQKSDFEIEIGDARLQARSIESGGSRPTIVFLHDSLGCIQVWKNFPEDLCLATDLNGLVYDRQGYGRSSPFTRERGIDYLEREADVLAELLKKQKLSNCVLFGHSDGGSIALIAAAKTPDLVACLITEGAHVFVEQVTVEGVERAKKLYRPTALRSRLMKYHGENTDAMFSAWVDTWTSHRYRDFNMEHFLLGITCPVMAMQGVDDEYGTEKQVDAIVSQVKGPAVKLMIPDARHTPHREKPDIALQAACSFIKDSLNRSSL